MEPNSNKKICPKCYFVNDDFVKVCMKCGHTFQGTEDVSAFVEPDETPAKKPKSDNPKAPKKTCPACGARVYISRMVCDECNHRFEVKGKKTAKPQGARSAQPQEKRHEIERAPSIPLASYIWYLIFMAASSLSCFFLIPMMYESRIGMMALIVEIALFFVAIGIGVLFGYLASMVYGYRSSRYATFLSTVSIIGVLVFDALYVRTVFPADDFAGALVETCMLIILAAAVIAQAISYRSSVKSEYCDRCEMANLVFFLKSEDGESHEEYKFVTHEAKTETATVSGSSNISGFVGASTTEHFEASESSTYTIKYKTPEWQENLGLHRYTKYTKYYQCKRCGRITTETGTREEKV